MEIGIVDVQKKFVQSEFAVCSLYKRVLRINLLKSISQSTSILFAEKTNRKLAFTPHAQQLNANLVKWLRREKFEFNENNRTRSIKVIKLSG